MAPQQDTARAGAQLPTHGWGCLLKPSQLSAQIQAPEHFAVSQAPLWARLWKVQNNPLLLRRFFLSALFQVVHMTMVLEKTLLKIDSSLNY